MIKKRHASSDAAKRTNGDLHGPPRGGWVYGSFNGAADLSNGSTLQRKKKIGRASSFDKLVIKRSDSSLSSRSDVSDISLPTPTGSTSVGKFSMLEFSMMYFRQNIDRYEALQSGQKGLGDSIKLIENLKIGTVKRRLSLHRLTDKKKVKEKEGTNGTSGGESWSWREQAECIKWTDKPIQSSLLKLPTEDMSFLATESFLAILMFSGDHELQGRYTAIDCVITLLKACHTYAELRDEIYCQLTKQTTNNKSENPESCQQVWRLFTLIACWFPCSDVLKPYLMTYLQQHASDPSRTHHSVGMVTLQMVKKTLRHGGRRNIPSSEEIQAFADGKRTRRQRIHLPCSIDDEDAILIHINPATLVREILEEVCHRIGILSNIESEEYCLFILPIDSPHEHPTVQGTRLKKEEYILDVVTEWRLHHNSSCILLRRICWFTPLNLTIMSEIYTDMMYQQCAQQYLDGWLIIPAPPNMARQISPRMLDDILRIASIMWRLSAYEDQEINVDLVEHFVPDKVMCLDMIEPEYLLSGVRRLLTKLPLQQSDYHLKLDVLSILSRWPMFGASFYYTKCTTEPKLSGKVVLAVNRAGIHFLKYGSHSVILSYPYTEVLSSRKVAPNSTDQIYLDIKVGNNRIQKVLRLETEEASDIAHLIGQYIKMMNNCSKTVAV